MLWFFSKIKEKVIISRNGNDEQKIFFLKTIWSLRNSVALSQGTSIFYTEMITQKQVEILIQLQKVFGPNVLDDLLPKIIGSRNMQTVLILSHILFSIFNLLFKFYFQQTWKSQQEVSGLRALLIDGTSSFLFT